MSRAKRWQTGHPCLYCGATLQTGEVCAQCETAARNDPVRLAAGGPLTERELGLDPGWPERELTDADDQA